MSIPIHPVLWRESHFVQVAAVTAAFTRLDEHGRPLETLAVWADEGHGYSACAAWRAAPSVRTQAAVVGSVETDAHAFSIRQVDGFRGFLGLGALLPELQLAGKIKVSSVTSHRNKISPEVKQCEKLWLSCYIISDLSGFALTQNHHIKPLQLSCQNRDWARDYFWI